MVNRRRTRAVPQQRQNLCRIFPLQRYRKGRCYQEVGRRQDAHEAAHDERKGLR